MAEDVAVLSLSTINFVRPVVKIEIDERGYLPYEMRSPEELSLALMAKMQEAVGMLEGVEDGSDVNFETVANVIAAQVDIVMPGLPDDVKEALTFGQHKMIVQRFRTLADADADAASEEN